VFYDGEVCLGGAWIESAGRPGTIPGPAGSSAQ